MCLGLTLLGSSSYMSMAGIVLELTMKVCIHSTNRGSQLATDYHSRIDHSQVHLQYPDGIMYYSPNCAATVNLPPCILAQGWQKNPILYFHEDMSSSVFKPQWWTCLFGWMSVIPKRPQLRVVSWDGWHAYILKKFRGAIQCLKTW